MSKLNLLLPLLLCMTSMQAQDFNPALMDSFLLHLYQNNKGMGSLAIMKGDQLIYRGVVGMADVVKGKTATVDTRYKIGSVSKTFTATMIIQLVDAGQLQLSTHLSSFYPEITNAERITIRQLLSHRTGIPEYLEDKSEAQLSKAVSVETLTKEISKLPSKFEPDAQYEYSNSNYYLLACIAEKISGQSYNTLLQHLGQKVGLKHTTAGDQETGDMYAKSYGWLQEWKPMLAWDMSWAYGAGAISSTAAETAQYMYALQSGKILSEASTAEMKKINEGYGLGLFTVPYGKYRGCGHNGRIENFESSAYHFPEIDLTFAYLSNGLSLNNNDILLGILAIAIDGQYDFPDFTPKTEVQLSAAQLQLFEGEYKSATFPLDVKVFLSGEALMAQATGQGPFPLTAVGDAAFVFEPAGIEISFDTSQNSMTLKQAGMVNEFKR